LGLECRVHDYLSFLPLLALVSTFLLALLAFLLAALSCFKDLVFRV